MPLHIFRHRPTSKVEHGRSKIDIFNDRIKPLSRWNRAGKPHQKWHPLRFLIHPPLILIIVLAQHEPLIGGVDDQRVIELSGRLKLVQETPEVVVDALYASQKFSQIRVVGQPLTFFFRVIRGIKSLRKLAGVSLGQILQI